MRAWRPVVCPFQRPPSDFPYNGFRGLGLIMVPTVNRG